MEMSCDKDRNRKNLIVLKCHVTLTEIHAYKNNYMQIQNHSLAFIQKHKSLLSATSSPSCSLMAYNATASLEKLTCADYVDFGKCQLRFGRFSGSKNDSNDTDVKPKVFKKDDIKEFRLVQNLTMGEADFNQFMRLRNQLFNVEENFAREENSTTVLLPTMSKDMDEHLHMAQKVVDVVDRANKKICATLLLYNMEKPESSYAQV